MLVLLVSTDQLLKILYTIVARQLVFAGNIYNLYSYQFCTHWEGLVKVTLLYLSSCKKSTKHIDKLD